MSQIFRFLSREHPSCPIRTRNRSSPLPLSEFSFSPLGSIGAELVGNYVSTRGLSHSLQPMPQLLSIVTLHQGFRRSFIGPPHPHRRKGYMDRWWQVSAVVVEVLFAEATRACCLARWQLSVHVNCRFYFTNPRDMDAKSYLGGCMNTCVLARSRENTTVSSRS